MAEVWSGDCESAGRGVEGRDRRLAILLRAKANDAESESARNPDHGGTGTAADLLIRAATDGGSTRGTATGVPRA